MSRKRKLFLALLGILWLAVPTIFAQTPTLFWPTDQGITIEINYARMPSAPIWAVTTRDEGERIFEAWPENDWPDCVDLVAPVRPSDYEQENLATVPCYLR